MPWIQNSRGYWEWKRDEKTSSWSSGRLIDTTSYYTSSYYNSKYKYSWIGDELSEEDIAKQVLISKAYKAAKDMVVVLDLPFKVKICVENTTELGSHLKPGERRICVQTQIFDKLALDDTYKVNVFCGASIHEACHLKYTAYRVIEKFGLAESDLVVQLADLIEDYRVEKELIKERPGYTDFITILNEYEFNNLDFLTCGSKDYKEVDLFNNLIKFIRYPENIDPKIIKSHEEFFDALADKLKGLTTTKGSCELAKEVLEYIKLSRTAAGDLSSWMKKNFTQTVYGADSDSGKEFGLRFWKSNAFLGTSGGIFKDVLYGAAERGEDYNTIFEYAQGSEPKYNKAKSLIKQYIPGIRKLLINIEKNYDFNIYGCRSGALDTNKLAEAYQNVPQVYVRQGHITTNRVSICVLVDESGSMCCECGDFRSSGPSRAFVARQAAILLNEGFDGIPGVGLYIYGHTADIYSSGDTILNIYREPGNKKVDKYSLTEIKDRQENRDGVAILEAAKRVRKLTEDHVLMIILSDGCPCADGYYGIDAWDDVKDAVDYALLNDMDVVQVNIGDVDEDDVNRVFPEHIDLQDSVAELPRELSRIIKKLVLAKKESTISM